MPLRIRTWRIFAYGADGRMVTSSVPAKRIDAAITMAVKTWPSGDGFSRHGAVLVG